MGTNIDKIKDKTDLSSENSNVMASKNENINRQIRQLDVDHPQIQQSNLSEDKSVKSQILYKSCNISSTIYQELSALTYKKNEQEIKDDRSIKSLYEASTLKESKNVLNNYKMTSFLCRNKINVLQASLWPLQYMNLMKYIQVKKYQKHQNVQSFLELAKVITSMLKKQKLYDSLIKIENIIEILQLFQQEYIDQQKSIQIIIFVANILEETLNFIKKQKEGQYQPKNQLYSSLNYVKTIAQRNLKLKLQIYRANKHVLKILKYIQNQGEINQKENDSFMNLKFNMSEGEIKCVATKIYQLSNYDERAFVYLTNYLFKCCLQMESQLINVQNIEKIFIQSMKLIKEQFQTFSNQIQINQQYFLQNYRLNESHEQFNIFQIKQIRAQQKLLQFDQFLKGKIEIYYKNTSILLDLIRQICSKSGYHSKLKMKFNKSKPTFELFELQILFQNIQKPSFSKQKYKISSLFQQELQNFKSYIKESLQQIDQPIVFSTKELGEITCFFQNTSNLKMFIESLKTYIQQKQKGRQIIKIIAIANQKQNKYWETLIQVKVNESICRCCLVLEKQSSKRQFNYYFQKVMNSKLVSPLAMLNKLNKQMSQQFGRDLSRIIKINKQGKVHPNYEQNITFENIQQSFNKFIQLICIKNQQNQTQQLKIDNLLLKFKERFDDLKHQAENNQIPQRLQKELKLRNGCFKYFMKQNKQAELLLQQYCQQIKQMFPSIFDIIVQKNYNNLSSNQKMTLFYYSNAEYFLAQINSKIGKYQKSLTYFLQIADFYLNEVIDDIARYITVLHCIGNIYYSQDNFEKALQYFLCCLKTQENVINSGINFCFQQHQIKTVQLFNTMSQIYMVVGNYIKAIQYYNLYFQNMIENKREVVDSIAYKNIGFAHHVLGNNQQAIAYYIIFLEIEQKNEVANRIEIYSICNKIAQISKNIGNYEQALYYYTCCLQNQQQFKQIGNINILTILSDVGQIYEAIKDEEQAVVYYERWLELAKSQTNQQNAKKIEILMKISAIYNHQAKYKKSLQNLNKCLQIQQNQYGQNSIETLSTLHLIVDVYMNQKIYPKALQYLTNCLQIESLRHRQSIEVAVILNRIGWVEQLMMKYQSSSQHYKKCIDIIQKVKGKNCIDVCDVLYKLGSIELKMENHQKSIKYFLGSLQIYESINGKNNKNYFNILNNLGQAYKKIKKISNSLEYYKRCLSIFQKEHMKDSIEVLMMLFDMISLATELGESTSLIEYLRKSIKMQQNNNWKRQDFHLQNYNLGLNLMNQAKEYGQAVKCFEKAESTLLTQSKCKYDDCLKRMVTCFTMLGNVPKRKEYKLKISTMLN